MLFLVVKSYTAPSSRNIEKLPDGSDTRGVGVLWWVSLGRVCIVTKSRGVDFLADTAKNDPPVNITRQMAIRTTPDWAACVTSYIYWGDCVYNYAIAPIYAIRYTQGRWGVFG